MSNLVYEYNVPPLQRGPLRKWVSSQGNSYIKIWWADDEDLVCPSCKHRAWEGATCAHCEVDFEEYIRSYYECFGALPGQVDEAIKDWKLGVFNQGT